MDMFATFRLLIREADGKFRPLNKNNACDFSVGGFTFEINGRSVPFDFNATASNVENGVIRYESGCGPFFNSHNLDDCYDDSYEKLGIERSSLTASILASTMKIEDFHVTVWDSEGKECDVGDNNDPQADLRLEIIEIEFADKNAAGYTVSADVIERFNIGGETNAEKRNV